jgi:sporulation protein YlmC with PRC-barrel domain
MRRKQLILTTTTAAVLTLSAPLMAETAQGQSESQFSPGVESDTTPQGGMSSQELSPSNPSERHPTIPSEQSQTSTGTEPDSTHGVIKPEKYVGKDAINAKGDKIGEVEKLVISDRTGDINAVLGVGGIMGIGEKKVVVPIEALQPMHDKVVLNTILKKDELKQGTPYEASEFRAFEPEQQKNEKQQSQ